MADGCPFRRHTQIAEVLRILVDFFGWEVYVLLQCWISWILCLFALACLLVSGATSAIWSGLDQNFFCWKTHVIWLRQGLLNVSHEIFYLIVFSLTFGRWFFMKLRNINSFQKFIIILNLFLQLLINCGAQLFSSRGYYRHL